VLLTTIKPEAVNNPPAPPPPLNPEMPPLFPPPPPPATTRYETEYAGTKLPLDVNVWIVLPPEEVTVPPLNTCEPA
jgi:hypothetical protein